MLVISMKVDLESYVDMVRFRFITISILNPVLLCQINWIEPCSLNYNQLRNNSMVLWGHQTFLSVFYFLSFFIFLKKSRDLNNKKIRIVIFKLFLCWENLETFLMFKTSTVNKTECAIFEERLLDLFL